MYTNRLNCHESICVFSEPKEISKKNDFARIFQMDESIEPFEFKANLVLFGRYKNLNQIYSILIRLSRYFECYYQFQTEMTGNCMLQKLYRHSKFQRRIDTNIQKFQCEWN